MTDCIIQVHKIRQYSNIEQFVQVIESTQQLNMIQGFNISRQIQLQAVPSIIRTSRISQRLTLAEKIQIIKNAQRHKQDTCLFITVMMCEIITIFLSLLLRVVNVDAKKWVYLTFIIMTIVRGGIFAFNSVKLIGLGRQIIKLYLLLDNVFIMMAGSVVTYIFLNYKSQAQFAIAAITCYPILLFFLSGNFRVMLTNGEWKKWHVISYKTVKIIGTIYFLIYGCEMIINDNDGNNELLILWIFTTSAYWAQMYFTINTLDKTDNLKAVYLIEDG